MIILQCPLDTRGKGEDRALSNELHSYWVNFAKTGDPNGAGLPQWPVYAPGKSTVMSLGAQSKPTLR